jgi:hypothetical protein
VRDRYPPGNSALVAQLPCTRLLLHWLCGEPLLPGRGPSARASACVAERRALASRRFGN